MNVKLVENEQELHDAFHVRRTVFVDEQQVPEEEEIDQYEKDAEHFVLYDEGVPQGAGRLRMFDDTGKVERICVMKEMRGNGAGILVMNAVEERAIARGAKKLKLNAQTHAIPFYAKLGYEVVSDEFLDAGIPHKTMVKHVK